MLRFTPFLYDCWCCKSGQFSPSTVLCRSGCSGLQTYINRYIVCKISRLIVDCCKLSFFDICLLHGVRNCFVADFYYSQSFLVLAVCWKSFNCCKIVCVDQYSQLTFFRKKKIIHILKVKM